MIKSIRLYIIPVMPHPVCYFQAVGLNRYMGGPIMEIPVFLLQLPTYYPGCSR